MLGFALGICFAHFEYLYSAFQTLKLIHIMTTHYMKNSRIWEKSIIRLYTFRFFFWATVLLQFPSVIFVQQQKRSPHLRFSHTLISWRKCSLKIYLSGNVKLITGNIEGGNSLLAAKMWSDHSKDDFNQR